MEYRNTFIALFVSLAVCGCDPKREEKPCLMMGSGTPLVSGAAVVRIEVYDGTKVHCDGSGVPAGAGSPDLSRSFGKGEKIALDVAPGQRTFVLTTFSDAGASIPLGEGCLETKVAAGSRLCFEPALKPIAACKSNLDCVGSGGAGATPDCDLVTHRCVQCLSNSECGGGAGAACCGNRCVNTINDKDNCGVCGTACGDGVCCTGGCATLATDFNNCGTCGQTCSANHIAPMCSGGACAGSCSPSFVDCNGDKRGDGCECPGFGCCSNGSCQHQHDNGANGSYYDCDPLRTFDSGHATAAALSASPSGTPLSLQCNNATDPNEWQKVICLNLPSGVCACWTYEAMGMSTKWIGTVSIAGDSSCICASDGGNNHQWN
jgi:hypothetical protein